MKMFGQFVTRRSAAVALALGFSAAVMAVALDRQVAAAQMKVGYEYRVLATTKTSTLEKEMNEAAEGGYRFRSVMGGDTAVGGSEVVAIMARSSEWKGRYSYKLLATSKTSTMEKELQAAADAGFEYMDQTVFKSAFGGQEVVCILERSSDQPAQKPQYKLIATAKTSTLQKELLDAGAAGYQVMGMTVGKTAMAGAELVAIMRRATAQ